MTKKPDLEQLPFIKNGGMGKDAKKVVQTAKLQIDRPVYQLDELNNVTSYYYKPDTCIDKCKAKYYGCHPLSVIFSIIPILQWLPRYKWRKNILGDIVSGITVAVMHIPQGMAYGLLGNLPPVCGIYMAFFPVLVYIIFGTSRHVSMGTFAIVCLMTGKIVGKYSSDEHVHHKTVLNISFVNLSSEMDPFYTEQQYNYSSIQVAITVTFTVAIIQYLMYVFRLGIVTTLLSETLVSAFTCGCAFLVVISQIKDLFGIPLPKQSGYLKSMKTLYSAMMLLPEANPAAVTISVIFITVMVLNNELLKPWLAKKTKLLFPIELIAVSVGAFASYMMKMQETYNVNTIGHIPTGLPAPMLPAFELIPSMALDAFSVTMVSYTISMSMALMFASKDHYEIDSNQELFALGCSNICGSFFSCMPVTASLSRSLIQYTVGGKTQIASLVSCVLLLVVLLWLGPLFETLPRCVLASIIVVALKNMVLQCVALKKYWNLSKWDALVWVITFFPTVIIGIDIGLLCGIFSSLFSIFLQGQRPYTCLLGVVPKTDLYLDMQRYKGIVEIDGIKVFHYSGSLNFANKSSFKSSLYKRIGFNPAAVLTKMQEEKEVSAASSAYSSEMEDLLARCIVLDFGALTYIDPSSVEMLRDLINVFKKLNIEVFIASCSGPVFETLKRCDIYEKKDGTFIVFPTIHDSVLYAQANVLKSK